MSVILEVDAFGAFAPIDAHYKIGRGFLEAGICRRAKKNSIGDRALAAAAGKSGGARGAFAKTVA